VADYGASDTAKTPEPDQKALERVEQVYQRWQDAKRRAERLAHEARESFDFDAGQQWSDEDLAVLEEQERPTTTFNRGSVIIDAVCGLEVTTRQQSATSRASRAPCRSPSSRRPRRIG
jgi:hypothetical protein